MNETNNIENVDRTKVPAELKLTESERKFGTPWKFDVAQTDPNSDKWYPFIFDRKGCPIGLDSDMVKFIIECVNRFHDEEKKAGG